MSQHQQSVVEVMDRLSLKAGSRVFTSLVNAAGLAKLTAAQTNIFIRGYNNYYIFFGLKLFGYCHNSDLSTEPTSTVTDF